MQQPNIWTRRLNTGAWQSYESNAGAPQARPGTLQPNMRALSLYTFFKVPPCTDISCVTLRPLAYAKPKIWQSSHWGGGWGSARFRTQSPADPVKAWGRVREGILCLRVMNYHLCVQRGDESPRKNQALWVWGWKKRESSALWVRKVYVVNCRFMSGMREMYFGSNVFTLSQMPCLVSERYDCHLCCESWEGNGKTNTRDLLWKAALH